MSLWWAQRDNLDKNQVALIEDLPLRECTCSRTAWLWENECAAPPAHNLFGGQNLPNVLVLSFTRPLTEFIKTGCFDPQGREIFPPSCVSTLESWIRGLYAQHGATLPGDQGSLVGWKKALANGALGFAAEMKMPKYDTLFVDEAQDLISEEVELISQWTNTLFFVGDARQRIYGYSNGLVAIRSLNHPPKESSLSFHYRLAPEICRVADRILVAQGGQSLEATCQYNGPRPGRIAIHGPLSKEATITAIVKSLKDQVRAYADLVSQGDLLGIIVARRDDRDFVLAHLEADPELSGKSQVVRAREGNNDDHTPEFSRDRPICILTVQGCKGLEFRAVHWPFSEELQHYHDAEHYYTVVTRAKTSLDIYYVNQLPQKLAGAYAPPVEKLW